MKQFKNHKTDIVQKTSFWPLSLQPCPQAYVEMGRTNRGAQMSGGWLGCLDHVRRQPVRRQTCRCCATRKKRPAAAAWEARSSKTSVLSPPERDAARTPVPLSGKRKKERRRRRKIKKFHSAHSSRTKRVPPPPARRLDARRTCASELSTTKVCLWHRRSDEPDTCALYGGAVVVFHEAKKGCRRLLSTKCRV